jgi:hypothetical protein
MLGALSPRRSKVMSPGSLDARREQVAKQIRTAFAGVDYPGSDDLVPETSGRDLEREELATALSGRDWRELDVAFLRSRPEALLLMSPGGFRFYLAAYALAAVENPRGSDLVPAVVVKSLTPPLESESASHWFEERVAGVSAEQGAALCAVLRLIADSDLFLEREAAVALRHWDSRLRPAVN